MIAHLSFIIPVYNVEAFLAKCLDSILNNSWGSVAYEIVIVNDASPDHSLEIANDYAGKYGNIKVISQENKGLGGARNTGIKKAIGQYLFFLDSDDYLIPNQIQNVVKKAIANNLDIIEFGAHSVDENYSKEKRIFSKDNSEVVNGCTYMEKYNFENSACNKLYRREFLHNHHLKFFERTYVEDAPFNAEAFVKASRVQAVSDVPVIFYQNINSITRQKRIGDNLRKFISDSIKVTTRMNEITTSNIPVGASKVLGKRVAVFTSGILLMILRSNFPLIEKNKYISELTQNQLYPVQNYSGILIRDLFVLFTKKKLFLNLLLRIL